MKYQPKVNQTQKYSDSQGEHIVHKGKLLLFGQHGLNVHGRAISKGNQIAEIKPIIISEKGEIEKGDYVFNIEYPERGIDIVKSITPVSGMGNFSGEDRGRYHYGTKSYGNYYGSDKDTFKLLALPEHFSDKHLQAIVGGKMKEGEILIKCKFERAEIKATHTKNSAYGKFILDHIIDLDQQNQITIFPSKQSLEEFFKEFCDDLYPLEQGVDPVWEAVKATAKWAKNN